MRPTLETWVPYLDGCEGGDDGGWAEAVGDEGEVGEVTLDGGLQYDLWPGVAQRWPVLVQQVHQLFGDLPATVGNGLVEQS